MLWVIGTENGTDKGITRNFDIEVMMKSKLLKFVCILSFVSGGEFFDTFAFAEGASYFCVEEKSAGFSFDKRKQKWVVTEFTTDQKFLLTPATNGECYSGQKAAYCLKEMGESFACAACKHDFNEPGFLFCEGSIGDFKFNKINGRFIRSSAYGYFNFVPGVNSLTEESSGTPNVALGKCSPMGKSNSQ